MPGPLHDKVALVAGSTRGAGRGIACMLGEAGATVYCTGRSTRGKPSTKGRPETTDETAEMVTARGGTGIAVQVDHTDPEQVHALLQRIDADQGRLDVLVNNVNGDDLISWTRKFWDYSIDDARRIVARGIESHVITAHAAIPLMVRQKTGLVVGITDRGGGTFFYGFTKGAVMRMAELLAPDLSSHGVTAVAVTPGYLRSEAMLEGFGVTEANWRDAVAKDPFFEHSETPFFVGRAVAALAADPKASIYAGRTVGASELAEHYGFTDVDGRRPDAVKVIMASVAEKWTEVVNEVDALFRKRGLDPDSILQHDSAAFTLRARVAGQSQERWVSTQLSPPELIYSKTAGLATKFYKRYASLR